MPSFVSYVYVPDFAHSPTEVGEQARSNQQQYRIDFLIEQLTHPDSHTRWQAARDLGDIGPGARDAVPALAAALDDPRESVSIEAASALGKIGPDARDAAPALVDAIRDPRAYVALTAVEALVAIGENAAPALQKALNDSDQRVRELAASILLQIQIAPKKNLEPPETGTAKRENSQQQDLRIASLIEGLKDADAYVRLHAVAALGRIGPDARDAVQALTAVLKDPDSDVSFAAKEALSRIAPQKDLERPETSTAKREETTFESTPTPSTSVRKGVINAVTAATICGMMCGAAISSSLCGLALGALIGSGLSIAVVAATELYARLKDK